MPRRLLMTVFFWAIVSSLVFFWNLGGSAIPDWDEGTHALVTREMRASGDWLNLTFLEVDYFRKPPLSFWVRGFSEIVFGESEFSVRFPSALAGVLTAGVLGVWVWQARRSLFAVHVTLAVFLTSAYAMYHTFRSGESDGLLGFFIVAALYCVWRSLTRPRMIVFAALATGLAVMTKSAGGLIPVAVLIGVLLWLRIWPYRSRNIWLSVVVGVIMVAPWHIYESLVHGIRFWGEYVGTHVLNRVGEELPGEEKLHGFFGYIPVFFRDMFPWSFFVPAAAVQLFHRSSGHRRNQAVIVLTCGVLAPLLLYSVAATKLSWYILPSWICAAALIGLAADDIRRQAMTRWSKILYAVGAMAVYVSLPWFLPSGEFQARDVQAAAVNLLVWKKTAWILLLGFVLIGLRSWRRSKSLNLYTRVAFIVCVHLILVASVMTFQRVDRTVESTYRVLSDAQASSSETITTYAVGFDNISLNKSAQFYFNAPPDRIFQVIENVTEIQPAASGYLVSKRPIALNDQLPLTLIQEYRGVSLYRLSQ